MLVAPRDGHRLTEVERDAVDAGTPPADALRRLVVLGGEGRLEQLA